MSKRTTKQLPPIPPDIDAQASKLKPKSKYTRKGIDKGVVASLKAKNPLLTQEQIGTLVGVDRSQVSRILSEYGLSTTATEEYKQHRADIFAGLQGRIIAEQLTVDAVKEMPPSSAALWFNSLYNNERLERGQATNINVSAKLELTRQAYEDYLKRQSGSGQQSQQTSHSDVVDLSHDD